MGKKLNASEAAFIYIYYELDPDDFRLLRKTADNLILWCVPKNKEVTLRR